MSSQIRFRDAGAPSDPDSDLLLRGENTVNSPLIGDPQWLGNGEAVAGVYTITATSGSTVNITADDPKNELVGTGIAVVADGSTVNKDCLKGVGLVLSASLAAGWTFKVTVGDLMASDGSTSDRFAVGIVEAGSQSTQRKIVAYNVGSLTSADSLVIATPGFFVEGSGAVDFIKELLNHTDDARETLATEADLEMTFSDYQTGPPETADVTIDDGGGGVLAIQDAKLDGAELYQYGEGNGYVDAADKLKGLAIVFADTPGDPSSKTFTIHVRRGYDWVEFAPDVAGSPGTWQSGPLTLTESGQTTGEITAGGYATFWFRVNIPDSAQPGDMVLFFLRGKGMSV